MQIDQIIQCDVTKGIPLPDKSVQCVVTSPPYWGLRDYGMAGQLGLEKTPEEYIERMVSVFRHVWRVLRDDGTCWVNMGDSYAQKGGQLNTKENIEQSKARSETYANPGIYGDYVSRMARAANTAVSGLKPKDLCMMPARLAIALQADGWYLRSDIIWAKPNPMPESVTDRPTKSHEHLFLLTKKSKYFYDADAVREPHAEPNDNRPGRTEYAPGHEGEVCGAGKGRMNQFNNPAGRNKRDVWTIATQSFPEAHFATFPEKLVQPCIKAGTSEKGCCLECGSPWVRVVEKEFVQEGPTRNRGKVKGNAGEADAKSMTMGDGGKVGHNKTTTIGWKLTCGHFDNMTFPDIRKNKKVVPSLSAIPCTVYDPFGGALTTCVVAYKLGRHYIATELNSDYIKMGQKRLDDIKSQFGLFEGDYLQKKT